MKNEKVTLRHGTLDDLMTKLNEAESLKQDLVVPHNKILSMDGSLIIKNGNELMPIEPNVTMDRHIATKLNIPYQYFVRMQDSLPDLLDASINDWLSTKDTSYMLRTYRNDESGQAAIGRAMLSDRYKVIDNLDILRSMTQAIMDNNLDVRVDSADISETKMYIKFSFNDVATDGGLLTANYRNPSNLQTGDTVSSGFTITNSEVGQGAFSLLPRLDILICQNGMTRNALGMKKTHLGVKLDGGLIDYSANTKQKNTDLIMAQMQDFVKQISSKEYLQGWVDELNGKVGRELKNPTNTIKVVSENLSINENEQVDILNYFTKSGDMTSNGILQAITYHAHQVDSPDWQHTLEAKASSVLDMIPVIDK